MITAFYLIGNNKCCTKKKENTYFSFYIQLFKIFSCILWKFWWLCNCYSSVVFKIFVDAINALNAMAQKQTSTHLEKVPTRSALIRPIVSTGSPNTNCHIWTYLYDLLNCAWAVRTNLYYTLLRIFDIRAKS